MNNIVCHRADPLSNLHQKTRDARHYELMSILNCSLANAYAIAHADFIWTFWRAMLMLSKCNDVTAARSIWGLKNAYEMKNYWDAYIASGSSIPKFEDLIDHWFVQHGNGSLSLPWTNVVRDALDVGGCVSSARTDQWCLDNTSTVIKVSDITAAFIKHAKNKNLYARQRNFKYLENPPPEPEVLKEVDSL